MRHFDFAPLYRSTIGFDRLVQLLDSFPGGDTDTAYPPYNIERLGENDYRITIAVAGFGPADIAIESKGNTLTVSGKKAEKADPSVEVLHQGIAGRSFERRFQLADHMEVHGARLENGLLHVEIVRVVPEAKRARKIAITSAAASNPKIVDAKVADAA